MSRLTALRTLRANLTQQTGFVEADLRRMIALNLPARPLADALNALESALNLVEQELRSLPEEES